MTSEKITAVHALGKKMLIDEEKVNQIQEIVEQEDRLREKRLTVLFPNGIAAAVREVEMEQ